MTDERLYDYSKGLNAPIGSKKSRQKRTRLWYFATPMQLSFFIVFTFVFLYVALWWVYLLFPSKIHLCFSTALLVSPYKLAKFYTEYEPHGKKMHVFVETT